MNRTIRYFGTFLIIGAMPLYAVANDPFGALQVNAQSPFQANSLTPKLRSGLYSGNTEFFASLNSGSAWIESSNYKMDYYQNQATVGGLFQVNPHLNVELKYQGINASDNNLDPITYGFHELFGIGQNGRDEVEYDEFNIHTPYGDIENFEGETLSQAITLYTDYQMLAWSHSSLTIGASLYYNSVNEGEFERQVFEQAIQLNYGYADSMQQFYTSLGISFNEEPFLTDVKDYRKTRWMFGVGYNYALAKNHRLIVETSILEGALNEGVMSDQFSDLSYEFTLGYRYLMKKAALELAMIENYINMDNSLDIGFTIGLRYQL